MKKLCSNFILILGEAEPWKIDFLRFLHLEKFFGCTQSHTKVRPQQQSDNL